MPTIHVSRTVCVRTCSHTYYYYRVTCNIMSLITMCACLWVCSTGLYASDAGLFRAWWPWCGHFETTGKMWVMAHHSQGTQPGWRFVAQAAGVLGGGGVFTAYVDPPPNGFTLVLYKPAGGAAEDATFTLTGPAAALILLHAVRSNVTKGDPDTSAYFLPQPDVVVTGGRFTLHLQPGDMWTLSTISTMRKGVANPPPPPAAPFPSASYADDFDACPISQEAGYWTDMSG